MREDVDMLSDCATLADCPFQNEIPNYFYRSWSWNEGWRALLGHHRFGMVQGITGSWSLGECTLHPIEDLVGHNDSGLGLTISKWFPLEEVEDMQCVCNRWPQSRQHCSAQLQAFSSWWYVSLDPTLSLHIPWWAERKFYNWSLNLPVTST